MRYKKKFSRKRKPKEPQMGGLAVKVYNNNIELALKKLKRKIKNSGMMLELKRKSYFEKPSKVRREKKNLAKLRSKYKSQKEN